MGHPHTRMTGAPWRNDKNGNFCGNLDFLDTLKFVWCGPGGTEDKDKVKKYAEEDIRMALTNVVERSFTMREIAFVETVVRSSTQCCVYLVCVLGASILHSERGCAISCCVFALLQVRYTVCNPDQPLPHAWEKEIDLTEKGLVKESYGLATSLQEVSPRIRQLVSDLAKFPKPAAEPVASRLSPELLAAAAAAAAEEEETTNDAEEAAAAASDGVPDEHRLPVTASRGGNFSTAFARPPGPFTQQLQEFGFISQPAAVVPVVPIQESFPQTQPEFDFQQPGVQAMIPETQVRVERVFLLSFSWCTSISIM